MPSYLGDYQNAATQRMDKFQRAVQSFIGQSYPEKELIIIADGCPQTINLYFKLGGVTEHIVLLSLQKQPPYAGIVRNTGIQHATGDIICYLDTDDLFFGDHLGELAKNFPDKADWVYFNDYIAKGDINKMKERETLLSYGRIGTSSIAHRRNLPELAWQDEYSHDWLFAKHLIDHFPNKAKITAPGYLVCHVPTLLDV